MDFVFEGRPSESPFVETVYRTQIGHFDDSFMSSAASHWEMVVTKQYGKTTLTVRGPETKASPAPVPQNAEIFGIVFKLGTFMPHLPVGNFIDQGVNLPGASCQSFWLHGAAWELPEFENVDTFVNRLVRDGLLVRDDIVEAVLNDHPHDYSIRTVRRRFLQATGLTHSSIQQIERARRAAALLQQGYSILDTVFETGYFDQPHLTKSLKYLIGQTPAQMVQR